jgi:hypothetical protein
MLELGFRALKNSDRYRENANWNGTSGNDWIFDVIQNKFLSVREWCRAIFTGFGIFVYLRNTTSILVPESESRKPTRDSFDIIATSILSSRVAGAQPEVLCCLRLRESKY